MTNYWVFKVTEEVGGLFLRSGIEIYNHRMQDAFWGINLNQEKTKTKAQQLEEGDHVVFYLVAKGHLNRFLGTAVLNSKLKNLDPDEAKNVVHKEFLDYESGVLLKSIDKWVNFVSVEDIRGKGIFASGKAFSQFFEGSIKKLKNQEEFNTIIQEYYLLKGLNNKQKSKQRPSQERRGK